MMGLLYSTDLSIWPVILELCDKNAICDDMKALTLREARRNWERDFIVAALRRNDMNVTAAARELDFVREPLCRKLKDLGIAIVNEKPHHPPNIILVRPSRPK